MEHLDYSSDSQYIKTIDNTTNPVIRFSVIIPNYNNGKTLKRAINSVLTQSYLPHEIIVIDDGSTDSSASIASEFGKSIIFKAQPNAGVSAARNTGASIATGDWLAFLDADDIFLPDRLKAHADWIATEPDLDFLLGNQEQRNPTDSVLMHSLEGCSAGKSLLARFPNDTNIPLKQQDFEGLIADGFGEIRTLSVPKITFNELNGFQVGMRIGEDLHFLIRLCARSIKAGVVTSTLAVYYIYPTSALRKDILRSQKEFVESLETLANEICEAPTVITTGLQKKIRYARLSLAYAYLRDKRNIDAIRSILPSFLAKPNAQSFRDVLSIIKG